MRKDLKFELEQIQNFIDKNFEKIEDAKIERFNNLVKDLECDNCEEAKREELYKFINELDDEFGYKKRFVKLYRNIIDFDDIISTVDKLKEICNVKQKERQEL